MRGTLTLAVCAMLVAGQAFAAASASAEVAKQRGRAKSPPETVNLAKVPVQPDDEHPDTALPDGLASSTPHAASATWSSAEVAAARAKCQALLANLNVVFIQSGPIKEKECGAPAPIELISIGTSPQVSLSPPPIVTCDMAAALSTWLDQDVQPAARQLLGGPVIRLEIMSAYSCRNAYARRNTRLSEHGRANAVDIAGFITERGDLAGLKSDWGETSRDIEFKIAAAKAEAERLAKAAAAKSEPPQRVLAGAGGISLRGTTASEVEAGGGKLSTQTTVLSLPGTALTTSNPTLGLAPPSRLGGPKAVPEVNSASRQAFLRRIHERGCRHFGTVLGPEANEAHRNHFHLDMAERKVKRICE
jgi:hypothetical protein